MVRKWAWGVIAVVTLISVGGVGFAAFSSSITASVQAKAGQVMIVWSGVPSTTTSGGAVTCTATSTTAVLAVQLSQLAPGDSCSITDGILNEAGSNNLAATISSDAVVTNTDGLACGVIYWFISDSYSTTPSALVEPGATIADTVVVGLSATAPNACSSGAATFTDTVTGTASG